MDKESPELLNPAADYNPDEALPEIELKEFLAFLGSRIKQLRQEKELTMREIMVRIGYYDAQWRNYESGGSALSIASLMKVAIALRVSLSELLGPLGQWPLHNVAAIQLQQGRDHQEIKVKRGRRPKQTPSPTRPLKNVPTERDLAVSKSKKASPGSPRRPIRRSKG